MDRSFSYFGVVAYQDQLYVEDTGNCCLSCGDDDGHVFYLIISTDDVGMCRVLEFGPISLVENFSDYRSCCCSYKKFAYNVTTIDKTIRGFINRKGFNITYAMQVTIDEVRDKIFNISEEFFNMIGVE